MKARILCKKLDENPFTNNKVTICYLKYIYQQENRNRFKQEFCFADRMHPSNVRHGAMLATNQYLSLYWCKSNKWTILINERTIVFLDLCVFLAFTLIWDLSHKTETLVHHCLNCFYRQYFHTVTESIMPDKTPTFPHLWSTLPHICMWWALPCFQNITGFGAFLFIFY